MIEWLSPREHDEWAEYRDAEFLHRLGRHDLVESLQAFWPKCGPRWDGLGKPTGDGVVLVEAKSHLGELTSKCGAGKDSLPLISGSLGWAKCRFGAFATSNWHGPYYQYANRLAHVEFLRHHGVDTVLVFVYFCDDTTMPKPVSAEEWMAHLPTVHSHLGIQHDLSSRGVINVFVPISVLRSTGHQ